MKIFGKDYSREEIWKKTGDISQLGGVKCYEYLDGMSRGMRGIDIKTPCGMNLTILPDRGMDISDFLYKSVPIAWRSATGETSPVYYESRGNEWLRSFFGGLITTCGLTTMGMPSIDNGEELGLHGRISNLGAYNVSAGGRWEKDEYIMEVQGKVREARVFGEKLELTRKISATMSKPELIVEDIVENIGSETSPLMILYHINIGFPVVDKGAVLLEGKAKVTPRDAEAEKDFDTFNQFIPPARGFVEQVYFHDIEADSDGNGNIAIVNENFDNGRGLGIRLKYNKDNLPFMNQWKQMGYGEYTCGIEPCNSLVRGRKIERQEGTLKFIEPGQSLKYRLEFSIVTSSEEIKQLKDRIAG